MSLTTINVANVRAFGATGNGTTNDSTAVNAAISSLPGGGTVYFPAGVYRIGRNLIIPANVTVMFSNGASVKIDTSIRITVNGPLDAGLYPIFSGTGIVNGFGDVEKVYPQWWGAKGDGTGDDTSAIQSALNTGRPVYLIKGTYKVNGGLEYRSETNITLLGEPGTLIDGTASKEMYLIHLGGKFGTSAPMLANATAGGTSVSVNLPAKSGDVMLITSKDLWNDSQSVFAKGEMIEAGSRSGTTITLKYPLYDSYRSSTTIVYAMTTPQVIVEHIDIIRNSDQAGLWIECAKDVSVKYCKITGARERCFYLSYTFGGTVEYNEAYDFYNPNTGTSYGLMVATCQNITERGNHFSGGRHAIAHGGWEPTRNCLVTENVIDNYHASGQPSLDFHGNNELHTVTNNVIYNGMIYLGRNGVVNNNLIYGDNRSGIHFWPTMSGDFMLIQNNRIFTKNATNPNVFGISIMTFAPNVMIDLLQIENNYVRSNKRGINVEPYDASHTNAKINKLQLSGNDIASDDYFTLFIGRTGNTPWQINELTIDGGSYKANGNNIYLDVLPAANRLSIRNANLSTSRDGTTVIYNTTGFNDVEVENSILSGTNSSPSNFNNTGTLSIRYSRFENFKGPIQVPSASDFYENNNTFVNSTGTFSVSKARRLTERYADGNVTGRGNAAPVSGTWKQGDQIVNNAPTLVKNIALWTCVASGTPGAWSATGCGFGTTAQRPALTSNDAGYLYKDRSVDRILLWNGSSWV
ncbi:right-handed parallel beta-helix repeat-containing protein [Paenibacillus contaminans]|nr:glycosyl hydrolase family 28-related protein [Paenibacillus contaminans]